MRPGPEMPRDPAPIPRETKPLAPRSWTLVPLGASPWGAMNTGSVEVAVSEGVLPGHLPRPPSRYRPTTYRAHRAGTARPPTVPTQQGPAGHPPCPRSRGRPATPIGLTANRRRESSIRSPKT